MAQNLPTTEMDDDEPRSPFERRPFVAKAYGTLSEAASRGSTVHSPRPLTYLAGLRCAGDTVTARDHALLEVLLTAAREQDATFQAGSFSVSLRLLRALFGPAVRRFEIVQSLERLQTRDFVLPGTKFPKARRSFKRWKSLLPEDLRVQVRTFDSESEYEFDLDHDLDRIDEFDLRLKMIESAYVDAGLSQADFVDFCDRLDDSMDEDKFMAAKELELGIPVRARYQRPITKDAIEPDRPVRSPVDPRLAVVPAAPASEGWWGARLPTPVAFKPILRHVIDGDEIHLEIDPYLSYILDGRREAPFAQLEVLKLVNFNCKFTAPLCRHLLVASYEEVNLFVSTGRRSAGYYRAPRLRQRLGHFALEMSLADLVEVTGLVPLERGLGDQIRSRVMQPILKDFQHTRKSSFQVRRGRFTHRRGMDGSVVFDCLHLPILHRMLAKNVGVPNGVIWTEVDRLFPKDEPRFQVEHATWRRVKERFGLDEDQLSFFIEAWEVALHEALHPEDPDLGDVTGRWNGLRHPNSPERLRVLAEKGVEACAIWLTLKPLTSRRRYRDGRLLSYIRTLGPDLTAMLFCAEEHAAPDLTEIGVHHGLYCDGTLAYVRRERQRRHAIATGVKVPDHNPLVRRTEGLRTAISERRLKAEEVRIKTAKAIEDKKRKQRARHIQARWEKRAEDRLIRGLSEHVRVAGRPE